MRIPLLRGLALATSIGSAFACSPAAGGFSVTLTWTVSPSAFAQGYTVDWPDDIAGAPARWTFLAHDHGHLAAGPARPPEDDPLAPRAGDSVVLERHAAGRQRPDARPRVLTGGRAAAAGSAGAARPAHGDHLAEGAVEVGP